MKTRKTPARTLGRVLRTGLMAAALAAVVGGAATAPAFADEWRHERGDRHGWREHERFEHRHVYAPRYDYGYVAPGYGYYGYRYVPAPVYAAPGLTFGFDFR